MGWISDHDRFQKLSSGTQSLVIAIGFVIGGAWTAMQFHEYERVGLSAERDEATRLLADIDIHTDSYADRETCTMVVVISAVNRGKRDAHLDLDGTPLRVARVTRDSTGQMMHAVIGGYPTRTFSSSGAMAVRLRDVELRPGETGEYPFLVPDVERGLHFVEFRAPVQARGEALDTVQPWHWTARAYVNACVDSTSAR